MGPPPKAQCATGDSFLKRANIGYGSLAYEGSIGLKRSSRDSVVVMAALIPRLAITNLEIALQRVSIRICPFRSLMNTRSTLLLRFGLADLLRFRRLRLLDVLALVGRFGGYGRLGFFGTTLG